MHRGRNYPFWLPLRILSVGQFDWPLFCPRTYDFAVTRWADNVGVHPFVGTVTSMTPSYTNGNDFATYEWDWPCDPGHSLIVTLRLQLNGLRIGLAATGEVHLDGSLVGSNGTIAGLAGDLILWGDWTGPIGPLVTPQHAV